MNLESTHLEIRTYSKTNFKQTGIGPSRRHIKGSKLPKGLQNVKVLVNWGPFYGNFFSKKSLTMPKKTERGTIWDFSKSILSKNIKKLKVGPFGEKQFFFEKKSHRAKNTLWPR